MATLTIADLDNGKRDLQTVSAVANSRAETVPTRLGGQTITLYEALRQLGERGDAVIRNLGFMPPVDYAPGLAVNESNFTVVYDGVVYAAQAGSIPFVTGSWDSGQWYPIQNELNDRKLLVFGSIAEAQAAAGSLPAGQAVVVESDSSRSDRRAAYKVSSAGGLSFSEYLDFKADGADSVVRTLVEKAGDALSIMDFGAAGGGSDDTESINGRVGIEVPRGEFTASAKEAVLAGPGRVVTGAGDILFDGLDVKANTKTLAYFAARMAAGDGVKIACYGDSTTDGNNTGGWTTNDRVPVTGKPWPYEPAGNNDHNLQAPNAWPIKLQQILRAYYANENISVFNCGYSGQKMSDGWANTFYEKAVIENPFVGKCDIVFIGFGLNDASGYGSSVIPHIRETIKVVQKVIRYGGTPVLLTCDANWKSTDGWSQAGNGYENTEAAQQIDAAKRYMAEKYGIELLDMDAMLKLWITSNDDGNNFFIDQSDALHFGNAGHAMKAMFAAKSMMPDIFMSDGKSTTRIHWMDSRAKFAHGDSESWSPSSGSGGGYRYSRFPRIFYLTSGEYLPNEAVIDAWVWCEGVQPSMIYRGVSNQNIGSTAPNESSQPKIRAWSAANLATPTYDKAVPQCGRDEAALNTFDRPFYCSRLRYGLNRIQIAAPDLNDRTFWGGWIELNPEWKSKESFPWFPNSNAPAYVQMDALRDVGGQFEDRYVSPASWGGGLSNNPVAFVFPESRDGINCADFGNVGDRVDILVEGFFDTETGFLFFGGKSTNQGNAPSPSHADNCLMLYASSPTRFDLHHLLYPLQQTAPYPLVQTGAVDGFEGPQRKFMIRCERVAGSLQHITVYPQWNDSAAPAVLTYTGDYNQLPGAGVVGGVFVRRNNGTTRTIRIEKCVVRKYK